MYECLKAAQWSEQCGEVSFSLPLFRNNPVNNFLKEYVLLWALN